MNDRLAVMVRWNEWYLSKVPFVWTACAFAAATSPFGDVAVLGRTAGLILFTCLCGAFGHIANDHADRACDRLAGRSSPAAGLTRRRARLLLAALGAAGLGILFATRTTAAGAAAGLAALLLAAAYSLDPPRLKGRGVAGVWSAAAAQRTLPVLTAFATLGSLGPQAWAFAAVAQLTGIRWMLIHQLADAANDRRAAIATYVVVVGESRARMLLRRIVLPLEILAVAAALWIASAATPKVWILAAVEVVSSGAWLLLWHGIGPAYALEGSDRQPLTRFYQLVWPLGAAVLLALSRPALWPIGAAFVIWELRFIRVQLATGLRLLAQQLDHLRRTRIS